MATTRCDTRDNSTSELGYTCNGLRRTCQAYLTFRSTPPFNSVSAISTLLSVNSSELSQLNSVSQSEIFQTDRMVLVPVTCSCSGPYYQSNVSYVVRDGETYLNIANNTFQSLTTCQALQDQNSMIPSGNLNPGVTITVPLRCACPTRNQLDGGFNFLLSYLVTWNQFVSTTAALFGIGTETTLAANQLSETGSVFPFTTLLIPLRVPPTSSQVTAPQPPPPPVTVLPPPSVPTPPSSGSSRTWAYVVVGVVGGLVVALVIGAIVFRRFFRKRKQKKSSQSFESIEKPVIKVANEEYSQDFLESISSIAQSIKVYPYQELKSATQDFSSSCLIKGSVYRGMINGDYAAIKKVNEDVSKEIGLLNKINHFNLVRLSGVSFSDGHWYLVYEYARNGALADWIHDGRSDQDGILDWNKRVQIALDVATGLNYLHRDTTPPLVHKDLNSSSVLLDQEFRAKIANFGLARSAEGQEGEFALTRHIVGTKGYMAPEYLEHGIVSPKLDVYAFGILLLEILTGKDVSLLTEEGKWQLSEVLTPVLHQDEGKENLRNLMDPSLQGKYPHDLAIVLFRVIENCLKKDPSDRPNMEMIVQSLSRIPTSALSGEWTIGIS